MLLFFVFSLVLVLYLLFLQYFATLSVTSPSSHKKLESPVIALSSTFTFLKSGVSVVTFTFNRSSLFHHVKDFQGKFQKKN